ncbi:hypothetical protein ACIO3R_22480 [Streptomyces sp. NPDC087428]|uniref:hypothetical protein n=1 Tax=Streptomyces sp. NPDC087428 TaxID=3365788 RepID=UPI00381D8D85
MTTSEKKHRTACDPVTFWGTSALSDDQVKALAAMFAERARQAQDGDRPSAALPGR